ncbi:MAG: amidohydrolase family protein [Planctomycetota bacterium]|nr:amidohydrolase family protein [Planctomycetota bacterium]MDA0934952.1 amidohydrolase family protein [Planctomycetota bacterium]MDA1222461.1 amidohydrolase family protein [Planctomycetota bacterium]
MSAVRIGILNVALLAAAPCFAQDLTIKAPPQRGPVVIHGATIHVGNGRTIENGSIWFADGRIGGLGADGAPATAERVDGVGLHVWPGMISAATRVGLNEIESISATQDFREIGDFSPEVFAAVAVNPDATTIPVTRTNGVLTVGVFPSGGLVPGRPSLVQLAGWTTEDMAVRNELGLSVQWPTARFRSWRGRRGGDEGSNSTDERRHAIDAFFDDASAYQRARSADSNVPLDIRFAAMQPVLDAQLPVFLGANDSESIQDAVTWAVGRGLRPVIVGGHDADLCTDFLREHDVPVVVLGTHRLPGRRDDPHDRPFRLPAVLHEAGVRFCISGEFGYENERNLPYHAAKAVAYGLPLEAAEHAVTSGAAEILGVGDELGTLDAGKRATLILTDGHPLEVTTHVRAAWVSGRRIDLTNKQTRLARKYEEKYRQLGLWPEGGR